MKKLKLKLEPYRLNVPEWGSGDANNGAFIIKSPKDRESIMIIMSDGLDWEHVSVSRKDRTPTWEEMNHVKNLVFEEDEVVIQYHPAKKDYVNNHPYCLHMWRPLRAILPTPPAELVGIKSKSTGS